MTEKYLREVKGMRSGWIKLHRNIMESDIFNDLQLYRLWTLCLMKATHKETDVLIGRQTVHLQPGQFITGREAVHELYNNGLKPKDKVKGKSTVYRWLEALEMNGCLNIKKTTKYSVVTVTNWQEYQQSEHQFEQQMNNKRTTNEHKQEVKNIKNTNSAAEATHAAAPNSPDEDATKAERIPYKQIIDYLNEKANKSFKHTAVANKKVIKARWNESYRLDDFKHVIDTKVQQWLTNDEMSQYLRPATLFSNKFDSYLNEQPKQPAAYKPHVVTENDFEEWELT